MKHNGWVLFDRACGICSRWIPFWAPTLRRIGLETVPLQTDWVRERTGMSDEELLRDIRVLLDDGTVISGADAYFYCMKRIWWAWPSYVLFRLPMLNSVFRLCYRSFAKNRYKISRVCHLKPTEDNSTVHTLRNHLRRSSRP